MHNLPCRLVFITLILFPCLLTYASEIEPRIKLIGSVDSAISFWKSADFWGEEDRDNDLLVPRALWVVINKRWKQEADQIPVAVKKELFYRALVPLVLYANELILQDRKQLKVLAQRTESGNDLTSDEVVWIHDLALKYRLVDAESEKANLSASEIRSIIDKLLVRVDIIPAALALGQGAYESGYATSRFALSGNALFGQWTYGDKGIKPKEHRASKGNYRVAAYDWPFDSVRAYMRNLNTHRSYEEFRQKRALLRLNGEKLSGLTLADTLTRYSEKGQSYVDTLKSIIRVNSLDIADTARLRDEPMIFVVSVDSEDHVNEVRKKIQRMHASGELSEVIRGMQLSQD